MATVAKADEKMDDLLRNSKKELYRVRERES